LTIHNHSQADISLIHVVSGEFERIEIHQTEINGDMSRMQQLNVVSIPANQQTSFSPGGLHLMLHGATRPITPGEQIMLVLNFSDGSKISRHFTVKNLTDIMPQDSLNLTEDRKSNFMTSITVFFQHLLPQHMLTGLMYKIARSRWEPFKNFLISRFIDYYKVDMSIASITDAKSYPHFNAFFTRELKTTARPVDMADNTIVSPVDGTISQFGKIHKDILMQAKGKDYKLSTLLGGNVDLSKRFENGQFMTIYLSPRDYHRIHMPVSGKLKSMSYVPGKLYSVNQATTDHVNNLFAINERIISIFDTGLGRVALVMVGAIFVGSMEPVWAGEITPASHRELKQITYGDQVIELDKGQEMGRFNMGSTVILLFEPNSIQFRENMNIDLPLNMGSGIAIKN
ncbi:MAG: phosphatidylserine decarboxylase, partial [Gammaproteobacteria bacterium]|nr:phosphatidylserine decarboxylase [Gammaproteobacteria bacterium]